jgi:hypothetical protein
MPIDKQAVLAEIDAVLERQQKTPDRQARAPHPFEDFAELHTLYTAAIKRLSPPGSPYLEQMEKALRTSEPYLNEDLVILKKLRGVLQALRADYEADRLQTFAERVHSDLFSDFLEMAEYLLEDEGLKDAAAVLAGGVLEQHLRKLCPKHSVALPTHPKLDSMNTELAKQGAYGKNEQKQITAWAGIRNDAAHANYGNYTAEQVKLMVQGIRHFITTHPA